MARSKKKGIDYYSMDVDIYSDRKVRRLLGACGATAMAVLVRVLCAAYQEQGYFIAAGEDLYFDIADELDLGEDYVRDAVGKCVGFGIFCAEKFEAHGILTSARMQRNFLDATRKRRCNNCINEPYRLVGAAQAAGRAVPKQDKPKQSKGERRKAFAEHVKLTQREYDDLATRYGKAGADRMVGILGGYKGKCGREYDSDYRAILAWVVRAYNNEVRAGR